MKRWKRKIAFVLMFAVLATFAPVMESEAKGTAKLKAKDFVYTDLKGKKEDFIKISKKDEGYYKYFYQIIDAKNVKGSDTKRFKTNRKVKLGSTEAYVRKQYGKTSKKKINKKEKLYKHVKYNGSGVDISAYRSYLEYNYTKGKDKYNIRFYLDKKNKVTAVFYIKNLQAFYNFPNKEAKPGLTFQAPKGKKVTTKTINGKKTYMVPRGTKIKAKNGSEEMYMYMYDVHGDIKGIVYAEGSFVDEYHFTGLEKGKSYDLEKIINKHMESEKGTINTKKLGKYLYFALYLDDFDDQHSLAPAIYYFKFK